MSVNVKLIGIDGLGLVIGPDVRISQLGREVAHRFIVGDESSTIFTKTYLDAMKQSHLKIDRTLWTLKRSDTSLRFDGL